MSDVTQFSNSEATSKALTGNFFSQLRRLASEVESGIQNLQQELDSKKQKHSSEAEHTLAVNFLLHAKKDVTDLRDETRTKQNELSKGNATIDRVCELMKTVLDVQSQRLENVESYIEKYGYKRPVKEKQNSDERHKDSSDLKNSDAEDTDDDDDHDDHDHELEAEGGDNDSNGDIPKSPSCQTVSEKLKTISTPRLEDMYSSLSEETVSLLRLGGRGKLYPEHADKLNVTKTVCSAYNCSDNYGASQLDGKNRLKQRTPEPSAVLSKGFVFNNEQPDVSDCKTVAPSTPETPKLMTSGFKLRSFSKMETTAGLNASTVRDEMKHQAAWSQDKDVLSNTPEPPALLTGLFTFNVQNGKFETKSSAAPATPEAPKLLTPAFKLNSFCSRDVDSAPISNTKEVGVSVDKNKVTGKMRTPEAPSLLMPGFKLSSFAVNPLEKKGGKSARSLFNTPPKPELNTHVPSEHNFLRHNADAGSTENTLTSSRAANLSMPETPQLLSHGFLSSHQLRHTAGYK